MCGLWNWRRVAGLGRAPLPIVPSAKREYRLDLVNLDALSSPLSASGSRSGWAEAAFALHSDPFGCSSAPSQRVHIAIGADTVRGFNDLRWPRCYYD